MQSNTVMAFRKRLKKRGYANVSIFWSSYHKKYRVEAVEPLAHFRVSVLLDEIDMHNAFRF